MNYFDLHCDTPYECYFKNQPFSANNLAVSGEKGAEFESWRQVFAVWIRDDIPEPFKLYSEIMRDIKLKLKATPENLQPLFAVEGGAVIGKDLKLIETLKSDGVRYLTLTWNGENAIAGGSGTDKGLTRFGREVIRELNRLKICTDLSHLNDKSFFAAIERAEYPIASHSNSRGICPVPRNLTDEQLKLIGAKNGLIGLCFYPKFLGGDVFEKIYENICRLGNLGLENNIAIGSDFDGADMPPELSDISKVPDLYTYLEKRGISAETLKKIFYENAQNYFDKLSGI